MKTIKFYILSLIALALFSCSEQSPAQNDDFEINQSISKIEVYDFHSTHRCITCNAIESNTKHTLDTYFSDELKNETISFHIINVDEEKNISIAEKFEAAGTALILNVISKGKEKQVDLTDFAFMKGKDKEDFTKELKLKIENELKTL